MDDLTERVGCRQAGGGLTWPWVDPPGASFFMSGL